MERFIRRAEPSALNLHDLLEARDHYYVHIANLPTVIGTAVGRYRIRQRDLNFSSPEFTPGDIDLGPRTLDNSDFKPWSWPCVLVFVNEWLDKETIARHPELSVPPVLYLPDGRQVRTCPILVEKRQNNLPPAETTAFASDNFGPGFQVYVADQGSTRMGVASAIVEDGASAYALASRHLVADVDPGSAVFALPRGKRLDIGRVTSRAVDTLPLQEVYPGFAGRSSRLTLDAALVKLDSVASISSQYVDVGRMGELVDISADKMSLSLIGCPVFSVLPGGHRVEGIVHGLFYRHATLGGVDSLSEFLIGPRDAGQSVETRPGDSGAVWFWDHIADRKPRPDDAPPAKQTDAAGDDETYRPLAVQWGGQGFSANSGGPAREFVLATSMTAICKTLSVQVVQEWDTNQSRYWGKVGHYNIGYAACFALQSPKAQALFAANATAIGVSDQDIVAKRLPSAKQKTQFIALADVPDLVWRSSRGKDKANHFADMDEPGSGRFAGKTLLDLWNSDISSRDPQVWNEFYSSIDPDRKPEHRGALPFRVAQLYEVMVEAVREGHIDKYVCAAGVLAHYIGDACQPLHVSYLHHGQPHDEGDDKVHAVYEDDMLQFAAVEVVGGVKQRVADREPLTITRGGMAAADAVVSLMRRTVAELPPAEVVEVYQRVRGSGQSSAMWRELGEKTLNRMADGAITLATVWQSAWTEGGGDEPGRFTESELKIPIPVELLKKLYDAKSFAESKWLFEMSVPR
ncbi:hypothetical protein [Chitinolyticbacter meiyuanensis]|uniref:hypothetical protein n=1 Tax=Chitinolyticbacter meiyuanensis TaxID=682798 RepID=UPI0011E5CA71|nr:hypothetical protein [Chitinolyticbacter meiyuanensis]